LIFPFCVASVFGAFTHSFPIGYICCSSYSCAYFWIGWCLPYFDAPLNSLKYSDVSPEVKIVEEEWVGVWFLAHKIFGVKGTCLRVQDEINLHNPKKSGHCKLNGSGEMDLIRSTLSTSFTRPTTFGKRHHSPPYSTFYVFLWGLHPNVTFPWDSQVGVPKLGLLLFQNFGCSYFFQIKYFLKMWRQHFIAFKKIFPTMYTTLQLDFIWSLLSRNLWPGVKLGI
jgi:hypothetical protein